MPRPKLFQVALSASACFVGACSTSYNVSKVDYNATNGTTLKTDQEVEGLFYYLPKTIVNVEAVGVMSQTKYGPFFDGNINIPNYDDDEGQPKQFSALFRDNFLACFEEVRDLETNEFLGLEVKANPDPVILVDDNLKSEKTPKLQDFLLSSETQADPEHLYRLEIDPDTFASFAHTISTQANGIVTGANTTISDGQSQFAFQLVESGLQLAATVAGFGAASDEAAYCKALKSAIEHKEMIKSGRSPFDEERLAILNRDWTNVDPEIFAAVLETVDDRIAKFQVDNKALTGKKEAKKNYIAVWRLDPAATDYEYGSDEASLRVFEYKTKPEDESKADVRLSYLPGTATRVLSEVATPDELSSLLDDVSFKFQPAIKISEDQAKGPTSTEDKKYGYRYRVPVAANLSIEKTNGDVLATGPVQVAQFGPIASLPANAAGAKAVLNLTFNAQTGGLTTATVSADPISSTAVSQYVTSISAFEQKRQADQDAKNAAEKTDEAAAARADIDADLLEIERLKAEKELKELRESLGLPPE